MAPATVTVTQPAATVTPTSSSSSDSLSAGSIAAIVVGSVLGVVVLVALALFLLRRYKRHTFTRVDNPTHDPVSGVLDVPSVNSWGAKRVPSHSRNLSITSEPLISPLSWPPIPSTSRGYSPVTPPRSHSNSPVPKDSQYSPAKSSHVTASGSVSPSSSPYILNIPSRNPDQTPPSPKQQQSFFIHRMLQSRARASDSISLVHQSSLGFVQSPPSTRASSIDADQVQLLADAERTARDMAEDNKMPGVEEEQEEVPSESASMYSQPSASLDHPLPDPFSRQNSAQRRKSSRKKQSRLIPVAETPDAPSRSGSRPASATATSSLDSPGTTPRPTSPVVQSGTLPLLTSVNFGKDSTPSGTAAGSISTTGWGSSSSGRTSRYPSLAPSSIGLPPQPGTRAEGGTDWRHPPPGLSGLKTLQVGPLQNPHSPVEPPPASLVPGGGPAPAKQAHLRAGTTSSMPEVERRSVVQGGIARIDVTL